MLVHYTLPESSYQKVLKPMLHFAACTSKYIYFTAHSYYTTVLDRCQDLKQGFPYSWLVQKFTKELRTLGLRTEAHRHHDCTSESSNFQLGPKTDKFGLLLHQRLFWTPAPHPLLPLLLCFLLHHCNPVPPHRLQLLLPVDLAQELLLVLKPLLKFFSQLLPLFSKTFNPQVSKSIFPLESLVLRRGLKSFRHLMAFDKLALVVFCLALHVLKVVPHPPGYFININIFTLIAHVFAHKIDTWK